MRNLFPAPFVLVYSKRFSLTKKRKYVRTKTPLRLNQNVLAFRIKRPCVFSQTHLRFGSVCQKLHLRHVLQAVCYVFFAQ